MFHESTPAVPTRTVNPRRLGASALRCGVDTASLLHQRSQAKELDTSEDRVKVSTSSRVLQTNITCELHDRDIFRPDLQSPSLQNVNPGSILAIENLTLAVAAFRCRPLQLSRYRSDAYVRLERQTCHLLDRGTNPTAEAVPKFNSH